MLSSDQLSRFATDGFVVLHDIVPEHLLAAADIEIEGVLREDPPPPHTVGHHSYFLPPDGLPAADDALRRSPAMQMAEELVRPHRLDHALDHIQIALNVPPYNHRPGGPTSTATGRSRTAHTLSACWQPSFSATSHARIRGTFGSGPGPTSSISAYLPIRGWVPSCRSAVTPSALIGRRYSLIRTRSLLREEICFWLIFCSDIRSAAI